MVLTTDAYDAAYFGDVEESGGLRHDAGYTNYLRQANANNRFDEGNPNNPYNSLRGKYEKLLNSQSLVGSDVVELGGGCGHLANWGISKGINWICVDVSPWCDAHKVCPEANFVLSDGLAYLQTLSNNSVDVTVSCRFLECLDDATVQLYIDEIRRVTKVKQIHFLDEQPNPTFYNVRTIEQWEADFNWPNNKVVLISAEDGSVLTT